jgi:hypothetical protein
MRCSWCAYSSERDEQPRKSGGLRAVQGAARRHQGVADIIRGVERFVLFRGMGLRVNRKIEYSGHCGHNLKFSCNRLILAHIDFDTPRACSGAAQGSREARAAGSFPAAASGAREAAILSSNSQALICGHNFEFSCNRLILAHIAFDTGTSQGSRAAHRWSGTLRLGTSGSPEAAILSDIPRTARH